MIDKKIISEPQKVTLIALVRLFCLFFLQHHQEVVAETVTAAVEVEIAEMVTVNPDQAESQDQNHLENHLDQMKEVRLFIIYDRG